MDWVVELVLMIFFLLLKGFFSGSEIAMVNSDKLKLRHQAKMGNRGAALVLKLFRSPDVILGTTLVGTNVATVTISTLGALIFIDHFGPSGDLISVIVMTPILLILGEVVPKSVFQQKADDIASRLIYVLRFFSYLFYPVIFVFSHAVYCFKSLSLYKYSYSQLFQVMCRDAWELPSLALVGGEFSGVVQSCCTISRSTIFTNKSLKKNPKTRSTHCSRQFVFQCHRSGNL